MPEVKEEEKEEEEEISVPDTNETITEEETTNKNESSVDVWMIVAIVEAVIIAGLLLVIGILLHGRKHSQTYQNLPPTETSTPQPFGQTPPQQLQ